MFSAAYLTVGCGNASDAKKHDSKVPVTITSAPFAVFVPELPGSGTNESLETCREMVHPSATQPLPPIAPESSSCGRNGGGQRTSEF